MDHVRCTMYQICALAREVAEQVRAKFLNRHAFGSGKVLDKLSRLAGFAQFFSKDERMQGLPRSPHHD